jgi:hypothetical protein
VSRQDSSCETYYDTEVHKKTNSIHHDGVKTINTSAD